MFTLNNDILIEESAKELGLTAKDAELALDSYGDEFLNERTIIKLDKSAKLAQLTSRVAIIIAKEKNDPDYKKLERANRIRRTLKAKLIDKYSAQAVARARKILANSGK